MTRLSISALVFVTVSSATATLAAPATGTKDTVLRFTLTPGLRIRLLHPAKPGGCSCVGAEFAVTYPMLNLTTQFGDPAGAAVGIYTGTITVVRATKAGERATITMPKGVNATGVAVDSVTGTVWVANSTPLATT